MKASPIRAINRFRWAEHEITVIISSIYEVIQITDDLSTDTQYLRSLATGTSTAALQTTGNAILASIDENLEINGVSLKPLDKTIDSVTVGRIEKGAVLDAVTLGLSAVDASTNGAEFDMRYHNYVAVLMTVAGAFNWTFKLQGAIASGGTFVDMYDGSDLCSVQFQNGSRIVMWPCGAPFAKVVATEDADGTTATVVAVPFNR